MDYGLTVNVDEEMSKDTVMPTMKGIYTMEDQLVDIFRAVLTNLSALG